MAGGLAWEVFLAYPRPEGHRARELFEALRAEGLRVCFDQEVLRPGDDWHVLLPRHLRASEVVVALISSKIDSAHFARSELIRAIDMVRREGRRLVPVRLDSDATLPYGTEQLQALDMFSTAATPEVAAKIAAVVPLAGPRSDAEVPQVFCSRTPIPPRFFMGRDEMLSRLGELTRSGGATVVIQALHGLGGVGKTSLAAAAIEANRSLFDIVWWVRAGEPTQLVEDLAELAPHLEISTLDDPMATADEACRALQATELSWLVVFDNAPNERALEQWVPRRGNGVVLITSRSSDFSDIDAIVDVDTFPPEVAERFLRDRVRPRNPAAAQEPLDRVIDRLDGLPLALEQAAAWVAQVPNRRFARFVELYDDASHDPFPDGTRPGGYEHTATTTWRVSAAAAAETASLADPVMAVLGFLAPDDIPCEWLRAMSSDDYFHHSTPSEIDDALDALHMYSLITLSPVDTLGIHRVVQTVARRNAPSPAQSAAIRTLHRQLPGDALAPTSWPGLAVVAPHALALAVATSASNPTEANQVTDVLDAVASYQRVSGAVRNAVATGELALSFAADHLGEDHAAVLRGRDTLAAANRYAGKLTVTARLLEENVSQRERVQGRDHPDTLTTRHELARAYRHLGNITTAVELFEANLADRERVRGRDHPDTISSRHGLGSAYKDIGNLGKAIPLIERALADSERVLGLDHLETMRIRNDLGGGYMNSAEPWPAIPLLEDNLAHSEVVLGMDHPFTIQSRNNLARAYQRAGDVQRALPLLEMSRGEAERVLDPDHPLSLITRDRLALAYQAAGQLDRAVSMLETNLADTTRLLGREHPDTMTSRSNLALAYLAAGNLDRAIPMLEANLSDRERVHVLDHPAILSTRNHLALAYQAAGNLERAIDTLERVLTDRERVLGPDHPDTQQNLEDLQRARAGHGPRMVQAQPTTELEE